MEIKRKYKKIGHFIKKNDLVKMYVLLLHRLNFKPLVLVKSIISNIE